MNVQDLDDTKMAQALVIAMRDAGIGWLDTEYDPERPSVVEIEGSVDLVLVAQHFKRILLAEPVVEEAS